MTPARSTRDRRAADSLGGFDQLVEDSWVLDKLGKDAKTAFGGFVDQDIGVLGVTKRDDPDLVRLDLEDAFDGALECVLEGDDAFRLETEGCNGFDVERVGDVGSEQLDEVEFFTEVCTGLRHGTSPVAGRKP